MGGAHAQRASAGGDDHHRILDDAATGTLRHFLDGTLVGHASEACQRRIAICLEPQHSPTRRTTRTRRRRCRGPA